MTSIRMGLDVTTVEACSQAITERLQTAVDWSLVSKLHVYQTNTKWHEIDTKNFIYWLKMVHPKLKIDIVNQSKKAEMPAGSYDAIIVPVLAFDSKCNRLGLGAGWYDRFLVSQPRVLKIGLAYEFSWVHSLPIESHDQPLDIIVSEQKILRR